MVLGMGRLIRYGPGQSFYAAGDAPDAIFGIASGYADIGLPVSDDEEIVVFRARQGDWIGESALLARAERGLTVVAVVECDVFRLPGPAVRAHLAARPEDWTSFYRLSHRNAMQCARALAEALALSPQARFARTILRLAQPDGTVFATQDDLARLAGMSRASFRRAMGDVIASGALRTGYGSLSILDRDRLETLARGRQAFSPVKSESVRVG
jgi:CRP-like cAMP-binding protein